MSKKIPIDANYRIESSTTGCTLILEKEGEMNPETGRPIQVFDQWFYPDIKGCLKKYCRLQTQLECDTIEQVISKIEELEKKVDELSFKF